LVARRFRSGEHLEDTLIRYVATYNRSIPQRALGHVSPVEASQEWYRKELDLFVSEVNNLPGLDAALPGRDTLQSALCRAIAQLQFTQMRFNYERAEQHPPEGAGRPQSIRRYPSEATQ
jgi:hypothetical protein